MANTGSTDWCQVRQERDCGFDAAMEGKCICRVEDFARFGMYLAVYREKGGDSVAEVCCVGREEDAVCCWCCGCKEGSWWVVLASVDLRSIKVCMPRI
jgi:hypothetical protein